MNIKRTLGVGVLAGLLASSQLAGAQSLGDILKAAVRDSAKEVLAEQTERPRTRAAKSKPDYMRDSWNNTRYVPIERNGYTLLRVGMSDVGKFGGGVKGRDACDEQYLAMALTRTSLPKDGLDLCRQLEAQIQGRGREYDGAVRRDMPAPEQEAAFKQGQYSKLPLELYFHPSVTTMALATVQRRPKGLFVDLGNVSGSNFLAGQMDGVRFTLKGREVVRAWTDYQSPSNPRRLTDDRGHVRFFLPATNADMDKLFGVGSLSDQRMSGLDTLYYTIHGVRDIGRTPVGERLFEVTVSIDRFEIGMDARLQDPTTYEPKEKLVWTAGGPLTE